jgi:hypothetical protein
MRSISQDLINSGHAAVNEPIGKVEVYNHPFMLGGPLAWSSFATMASTPIDACEAGSGIIVAIRGNSYRRVTSPENSSSWEGSWSSFSPSLPASSEAIAIASSGSDVQVYARRTSAPWTLYVLTSADSGSSWDVTWTTIGTSTEANTNVEASARYNGLFLRHYATSGGVALEAATYYNSTWNVHSNKTGLVDSKVSDTRIAVIPEDNRDLVFFSAKYPGEDVESVLVSNFSHTVFSQPEQAIFHIAGEKGHYDLVRSAGTIGDRNVLVLRTVRTAVQNPGAGVLKRDNFEYDYPETTTYRVFTFSETWAAYGSATVTTESTEWVDSPECKRAALTGASGGMRNTDARDLTTGGFWGSGDFCVLRVRPALASTSGRAVQITFEDGGDSFQWSSGALTNNAWQVLIPKRSDFSESGSPDWSTISATRVELTGGASGDVLHVDLMTLEDADPADANNPNAFSSYWDVQPTGGWWTVHADIAQSGFLFNRWAWHAGCLDMEASVEKSLVRDYTITTEDYVLSGNVLCKRQDGIVGLWFGLQDATAGSEDGYAFCIDTANDKAILYSYTAGAATTIEEVAISGMSFDISTIYSLSVRKSGSIIECSVGDFYISAIDDTYTGGKAGFLSIGTLGRFDMFWLQEFTSTSETITDSKAICYVSGKNLSDVQVFDSSAPHDIMVARYSFDINNSSVYRADKDVDTVDVEISDDVLAMSLSYPAESSSTGGVELYNNDARYSSNNYIMKGRGLRSSIGYITPVGTEYANMGLFRINRIREDFTPGAIKMNVDGIDANWMIKNWVAQNVHFVQSQNRLAIDYSKGGADLLVGISPGEWELVDSVTGHTENPVHALRSEAAQVEAISVTGEQFYGVIAEGLFQIGTSGFTGIVFACAEDMSSFYQVVFGEGGTTLHLYKYVEGTYTELDTSTYTPLSDVWIRVLHHHNQIHIWTGNNGLDWTYELSYTDNSYPLLKGHVGVKNVEWTGGESYNHFLRVYSLKEDQTVDDAMRFVGTKAGVLDYDSHHELEDDFPGTSLDATKWDEAGSTLDTISVSGGYLNIASISGWQFINSTASLVDGVIDFTAKTTNSGVLIVGYRMDSTFQNGCLWWITPGAVGSSQASCFFIHNGTAQWITQSKPRVEIPQNTDIDFRVTFQGGEHSLWMGGVLLGTAFGSSFSDWVFMEGYVAFGTQESATASFDNIRIKKADSVVDHLTINPGDKGEALVKGLAKSGGVQYYIEGDAEMKIGTMIPASGESDVFGGTNVLTFKDQLTQAGVVDDDQEWVTHIRVVGKDGISVDYYDRTALDSQGYRFDLLKADDLTTLQQLIKTAVAETAVRNYTNVQRTLNGQAQLACQRGDRIHITIQSLPGYDSFGYRVDDDFIIRAIPRLNFTTGEQADITMTLEVEDAP